MIELRTERLMLRQWRDDDLDAWAALNADPLVTEFIGGPRTRPECAAALDRFRSDLAERGWGWWALEVLETGAFIGFTGLDPVDGPPSLTGLEIGWRLARDTWGQGYATEAAQACLAYAFEVLELPEVLAIAAVGNTRSHAVMRRLGMSYDPAGDFVDEWGPEVVYRIERARWEA